MLLKLIKYDFKEQFREHIGLYALVFVSALTEIILDSFEFDLDDRFFACFEGSELSHGKFHVEVEMEKKERLLNFNFHFDGSVRVVCDRCAEEFDMPLEYRPKNSVYRTF
jgi:hypothetical protein